MTVLATLLLGPRPSLVPFIASGLPALDISSGRSALMPVMFVDHDLHKRSSSGGAPQQRSGIEAFFTSTEQRLHTLYEDSVKIKCPFFRRRAFDTIEALKRILIFIACRHKSTPFFPSPAVKTPIRKTRNLPLADLAALVQNDWMGTRNVGKGYYVTGALTHEIYDEECFFDGPDPDMPVRGLRKYLLSASQLFDTRRSRADLIRPVEYNGDTMTLTAHWRIQGVLNLPWHPSVKPWTGHTEYHVDPQSSLITMHQEHWDISVPDAFISTLFPFLNFGAPAASPLRELVIDQPKCVNDFWQ